MRPLLLSVCLLSGCSLSATLDVSTFHCDDGQCPSGQVCGEDHVCRAPADDGGVDGEPGSADAGAPTGPCNTASLLADDFSGPDEGLLWWRWSNGSGTSVTRPSGRLRIDVPANHSQSAYAGYDSWRYYDLRDGQVGLRITHMVDTGGAAEAYLSVWDYDGDWLEILQSNGLLYLDSQVNGSPRQRQTVSYDPAQVYWRVRESSGRLYYEASADGSQWTDLLDKATPFDVSHVAVTISAGVWQSETNPGYFEVEEFNGGTPSGRYCKADTLVDDFEDGQWSDRWANSYWGQGCNVDEQGGALVGTPPVPSTRSSECAYQSDTALDLSDSQATIEVSNMLGSQPTTDAFFRLADEHYVHGIELAVQAGQLDCGVWAAGMRTSLGGVPWNASMHRFWRLSEAGGTIRFQVSPTGATWTTLCSTPTSGVGVSALAMMIGVGTPGATSGTLTGSFSVAGVNVP